MSRGEWTFELNLSHCLGHILCIFCACQLRGLLILVLARSCGKGMHQNYVRRSPGFSEETRRRGSLSAAVNFTSASAGMRFFVMTN